MQHQQQFNDLLHAELDQIGDATHEEAVSRAWEHGMGFVLAAHQFEVITFERAEQARLALTTAANNRRAQLRGMRMLTGRAA